MTSSNISNYVDGAYSANYTYNYLNQLKTAGYTTYTQDDHGNLLSQSTSWPWPATTTTYNYTTYNYTKISGTNIPTTNRLSSVVVNGVTTTMTYDSAGNLTAAGSTTYEWDAANRLKSVNSGSLGSYGYDGNGKRVKKAESGTTTYYVISSVLGSAMEVTSAGVQRAYVMNGGSVVAQLNPNGNFYWLHLDHLGSGRKMTDSSGNMTYRAEFDPYGKLLGLKAARRINPKSLNRYSYVEGDPINNTDPTGTFLPCWQEVMTDYWVNYCTGEVDDGRIETSKAGPSGGGGGGRDGGGGEPQPKRDTRTKEDKRKAIIELGKKAMEDPNGDCAKFISGPNASDPAKLFELLADNGQFKEAVDQKDIDYFRDPKNFDAGGFTKGVGENAKIIMRPQIIGPVTFESSGFYDRAHNWVSGSNVDVR